MDNWEIAYRALMSLSEAIAEMEDRGLGDETITCRLNQELHMLVNELWIPYDNGP